jgi:hypothetical protein
MRAMAIESDVDACFPTTSLCWLCNTGIYVDDILEAVPIDKYFELFKPKNGGEGGFIRVAMNFSTESADDALAGIPYGRCHCPVILTMQRDALRKWHAWS